MTLKTLQFEAAPGRGDVSALYLRPRGARALYVFAHGAGAGMHHTFMESMAEALAEVSVATLRFMFPYTEAGRRRPDHQPVLRTTVRSAVSQANKLARGLPVFAGGKSMGGRMTSLADSEDDLGLQGLIFLGFPLHPAGKDGVDRAAHLEGTHAPMLFISGTRDKLARLDLLQGVLEELGARATLSLLEGGDHSLGLPKRAGKPPAQVHAETASTIATWIDDRL